MTSVNVTTTANTVTVLDDGETVVVTTGDVTQATFDALVARVVALESAKYLVLQDGN
jgi:hypothetical protein